MDKIPGHLRSHVVYKIFCHSCNTVYIGETARLFNTRVDEHLSTDETPAISGDKISAENKGCDLHQ